ncbi:MAG TPA: ABC transporter permease [Bradyrhizobium sp.]|nr:ABC transporter permease [Bradyrhizobium sp.]
MWLSLSTVVAIALVVMVLLAFLAMANGFRHAMTSAGADDVAVILRGGADAEVYSFLSGDQVRLVEDGPGIARGAGGKPMVSAELYVSVSALRRATLTRASVPLRGIGREGDAVRKDIKIIDGRMFNPGANEIVVGKGLLSQFHGFELGNTPILRNSQWRVVGVFDAGGSVFESELWADLPVVQSLFNQNNMFQTIRARLQSSGTLDQLKGYVDKDPRMKLDVKSEAMYFANEAARTSDLVQKLGWPLAAAMAIGALAGALNAMYSSVAARTVEIATLRAIGFSGLSAFVGTLIEALMLATLGGAIGAIATFLIFDGMTSSTLGASLTQVVFSFKLSPLLLAQGIGLALIVGFIGGLLPAIHAARMPIVIGLHR